jgi:hypothetical protein
MPLDTVRFQFVHATIHHNICLQHVKVVQIILAGRDTCVSKALPVPAVAVAATG